MTPHDNESLSCKAMFPPYPLENMNVCFQETLGLEACHHASRSDAV